MVDSHPWKMQVSNLWDNRNIPSSHGIKGYKIFNNLAVHGIPAISGTFSNIQYVNIIIDVGTALNAFKFLWNGSEKYQNVVIHLGDFHLMKENFQVTGLGKNGLTFEQKLFTYKNGFLLLHRSPFLKCCVRMAILWVFLDKRKSMCYAQKWKCSSYISYTNLKDAS